MRNCRLGSLGSLRNLASVPHGVLSLLLSCARGVGATTPDRMASPDDPTTGLTVHWGLGHLWCPRHPLSSLLGAPRTPPPMRLVLVGVFACRAATKHAAWRPSHVSCSSRYIARVQHVGDGIKNLSFCARPKERSPALAPGPFLSNKYETGF